MTTAANAVAAPLVVYGIRPAWGLPCVSPFVTKVVYALRMAGVPFELRPQNPLTADADSPNGRLPYVIDGAERIADSGAILAHVRATRGDPLDGDATGAERAQSVAWTRLVDEHLYWLGVIRPRWLEESGWDQYRRLLFGDAIDSPEVGAFAETVRSRTAARFAATGLGRLSPAQLDARAVEDVEALERQLADREWLLGDRPRWVDATVTSMLRHLSCAPYRSAARDRLLAADTLLAYAERNTARCGF